MVKFRSKKAHTYTTLGPSGNLYTFYLDKDGYVENVDDIRSFMNHEEIIPSASIDNSPKTVKPLSEVVLSPVHVEKAIPRPNVKADQQTFKPKLKVKK